MRMGATRTRLYRHTRCQPVNSSRPLPGSVEGSGSRSGEAVAMVNLELIIRNSQCRRGRAPRPVARPAPDLDDRLRQNPLLLELRLQTDDVLPGPRASLAVDI